MIVLDTNVISELMKPAPDPAVRDWLMALVDTPLATTAVTVAEIEYGLRRLPDGRRRTELYARVETLIDALVVLPLDELSGRESGLLRALREAAGWSTAPSDMMIAGVTAVAGAALATRNVRDFRGLPIEVINPWRGRAPA